MSLKRLLESRQKLKDRLKQSEKTCYVCSNKLYESSQGYICLSCRFRKFK